MSKRTVRLLLMEILDSADAIVSFTHSMSFEDFINDRKTRDAVIMNFHVIGEAANKLPSDFKDDVTSVDWFKLRGYRNKIAHDYAGINYETVWQIKEEYLPSLVSELKRLLDDLPE